MRLTGRIRLSITAATFAVVVAAASTFAGQGEPPAPSAGAAGPAAGGKDPVIHVPAVHAGQALVRESKDTPPLPASALARLDIPPTALLAYQRAAAVMAQADQSCRLSWTLLAAIGRVESDHGRYAGAVLQPDGVSNPPIRGVALDGRGHVARVADTDGGVLDGDRTWDRAVGPMQFLPSTWSVVAVDGDGDGIRSPDDIDDAALAAGVFLCSGPEDLATEAGRSAAVLRYNPSRAYVASVLAVEHAYRTGDYALQGQAPEVGPVHVVVNQRVPRPGNQPAGGVSGAQAAGGDGATPQPTGTSEPAPADAVRSSTGPKHASGPKHSWPAGPHTPGHTSGPGTAGPGTAGQGTAGQGSTGQGDPTDPVPSEPPTPTEPVPGEPTDSGDPTDPGPTDPTSTPPETSPDLVTLTGELLRCGRVTDTFCVDDSLLDLGDRAYLASRATADLDADGTVESNADELDGLVGTPVSIQVLPDTSPALVVTVNGAAYRTP